eukprot:Rhum_TRINITY_DN4965_c0_g1::Rhum_TRINITY_DN4965_c0_g1_i1::g.16189::m.16189/K20825/FAM20B; glycosaminoglycan xylosylkinase
MRLSSARGALLALFLLSAMLWAASLASHVSRSEVRRKRDAKAAGTAQPTGERRRPRQHAAGKKKAKAKAAHHTDDDPSSSSSSSDSSDSSDAAGDAAANSGTAADGEEAGVDAIERLLRARFGAGTRYEQDEPPQAQLAVVAATGCNVFAVPFQPEQDAACLAYMSDVDNWAEVHPLKQKFDSRTIKFKVSFKHAPLAAMVKVPQRSFPGEPQSEVGAFHADRVVGVNRVPPTAWAHVPVHTFMAAAKAEGGHMKLVAQFARDSGLADTASFYEWCDKDFKQFVEHKGLVADGKVGVSVQLFVADVRRLLTSALSIPYKAHDGSWARWLDPRHPFNESIRTSMYHISELVTFDYVLGNTDRSPNKNNFVVGACQGHKCHGDPKGFGPHPGHPDFIHLDNGMCFYQPQRNPINGKQWTMCVYQKKIVANLRALAAAEGEGTFSAQMKKRLPRDVWKGIGGPKMRACEDRTKELLAKVDACLQTYDEDIVLP